MKVFCGIDWASDHHDIALVDHEGTLLGRARIDDDATGLQQLLDLLTAHGDTADTPIPVAIETSRGLLVACLRATGRPVHAINPMAAARYRERHAVARKKSDHLDAIGPGEHPPHGHGRPPATASRQRTRPGHRGARPGSAGRSLGPHPGQQQAPLPPAGVLPRLPRRLPGHPRRAVPTRRPRHPGRRPTRAQAARLTRPQLRSLLRKAGRKRGIEETKQPPSHRPRPPAYLSPLDRSTESDRAGRSVAGTGRDARGQWTASTCPDTHSPAARKSFGC